MGPESGVEGPACGWETPGDWWAIKTFQCPSVCEALSSSLFCPLPFCFSLPEDPLRIGFSQSRIKMVQRQRAQLYRRKMASQRLRTPGLQLADHLVLDKQPAGPLRPAASSRTAGTEAAQGRGAGAGKQAVAAAAAEAMAGKELERCQQQADEVTEIMLDNYQKVLERDGKLAELEQRSHKLLDMSLAFSKTTNTLAQKKRWENIRCRVYLGLAVAGGLLIILIVLLVTFLPTSDGESSQP